MRTQPWRLDKKAVSLSTKLGVERAYRVVRGVEPAYRVIRETLDGYAHARGNLMAAAIAFYTQIALAPLILMATTAAAVLVDSEAARAKISGHLTRVLGGETAASVDALVDAAMDASTKAGGAIGSALGVVLVAFTASRLVVQMRDAMNQLCEVDPAAAHAAKFSLRASIRRRLSAFALVLAALPVLFAAFASRALLSVFYGALFRSSEAEGVLVQVMQFFFATLVVAAIAAALFRVVPDTRLRWRSIFLAAGLTSFAWNSGNLVIGLYVGSAGIATSYGAAVSLVVIPLWLRFSASIFLCGVKLAQVHARRSVALETP